EFRSVFCAPSQNFKILVIPNALAHGKSYEHGFAKKKAMVINYAQSLILISFSCTISEFENTSHSKCTMGSCTSMVSQKNGMVINLEQSCAQSRVLISFLCTVS
ncbi:hypothetical protein GW17_00052048, partial [Ensete ventricosum]